MPFTLYHFGVGALAKSIAPKHVSFTAFAVANVLIDVEPFLRLSGFLDDTILHGPTHTFPGAVVIAVLTWPAIRLWDRAAAALRLQSLRPATIPTWMLLSSALVGTVSHILLDMQMHADMAAHRARYPGLTVQDIPPTVVELFCVELAQYALLIYLARLTWRGGRWAYRSARAWLTGDRQPGRPDHSKPENPASVTTPSPPS